MAARWPIQRSLPVAATGAAGFPGKGGFCETGGVVRNQLGFGRIEDRDALAFDLREETRFLVPDDFGDAGDQDRMAAGAGGVNAADNPFGIPDKYPRPGRPIVCALPVQKLLSWKRQVYSSKISVRESPRHR